jgi:hypothetical protein
VRYVSNGRKKLHLVRIMLSAAGDAMSATLAGPFRLVALAAPVDKLQHFSRKASRDTQPLRLWLLLRFIITISHHCSSQPWCCPSAAGSGSTAAESINVQRTHAVQLSRSLCCWCFAVLPSLSMCGRSTATGARCVSLLCSARSLSAAVHSVAEQCSTYNRGCCCYCPVAPLRVQRVHGLV